MFFLLFFISLIFGSAHAQPSMSQGIERTNVFIPAAPSPSEPWHSISTVYADIYYSYKDRHVAQALSRHANHAIPRIAQSLELGSGSAMKIYLMPTQESFARLQPGKTPDWADGTAWPDLGLIFLRSPDIRNGRSDPLTQVLDHEIAHIVLGRAFGERPVPRWLQEGVAQLVSGEHGHETTDTLSKGVLGENLLSLQELTLRFPAAPQRANLAYAQSADFIVFLRQTYGANALPKLISMMTNNQSFGYSIRNITGKTIHELDMEWRGELSDSLIWLKPLFSDTTLLSIGGLLLVYGFFRKQKIRYDDRSKKNEQNEIYELLERELRNWKPSYLSYPPPSSSQW
jgi:hypothetical protein